MLDAGHVVLAPASGRLAPATTADVRIEAWTGELGSYRHAGRVLVARTGQAVVGDLQLVETDRPGRVELKNMAVREAWQGRGVMRRGALRAVGPAARRGRDGRTPP
jgi:hypothetical protein